jgi:sodium pump decarboxylase gamma subunit
MELTWFGLKITALGMGVVMLLLYFLCLLTQLTSGLIQRSKESSASQSSAPSPTTVEPGEEEEVAVVTAAVAAALGGSYRVASVKKIRVLPGGSFDGWAQCGLNQLHQERGNFYHATIPGSGKR